MSRQMPKRGFYVSKSEPGDAFDEIIFVSGVKAGNKYNRRERDDAEDDDESGDDTWGWNTLTWTCVPTQATLDEGYTYYETMPTGWWGSM